MSTAPSILQPSSASDRISARFQSGNVAQSRETETAPDGPVLEHQSGAVSGNESVETADSASTVPREGGAPEVESGRAEIPNVSGPSYGSEEIPHFSAAVQTVYEFGAPLSHGAIRCAPWCTDGRGHLDAIMRADQSCWSARQAVVLGLAEGAPALPIALEDWAQLDPPHIAVAAYRAFHSLPVVSLHLYHPSDNPSVHVDFDVRMTPDEAIQLARFLLDAAALAGAGGAVDGR